MKKKILLILTCYFFTSCDSSSTQQEESTPQLPEVHSPVEVTQGNDVSITDSPDESEPYAVDDNLATDAVARMQELLADPEYDRRKGKNRRRRIANTLNDEGYRTSRGDKFRTRDIPKW